MSISTDLIRALYTKYAPDKNIRAQVSYVNANYTSQDKFVEDFYKEYGAELTLEKKLFIRNNFGGFDDLTPPDVDVEDYTSQLAISSEAAQFTTLGLSDEETKVIDEKFSSVDYFNETFEYDTTQILSGDLSPTGPAAIINTVPESELVMYKDLGITKDDHKANVDKEHKKLINPHAYNLTDSQVEEINAIRRKLKQQGLGGEELNNALIKFAKERVLAQYKQEYRNNLTRSRVNKYISNNEGYFGTLEDLRKEGKVTKEAGFNELEVAGPGGYIMGVNEDGVIDDPVLFALQGMGGGRSNLVAEVALDKRTVSDRVKMLKEQSIIFEDITRFTNVSESILEDYKNNEALGNEILKYRESASQPGFEYDAEVALEMEKKLSLYKANSKAILEVIPKIKLASKNIEALSAASDLLGKNYDLVKKNLAKVAMGFGDIGLGGLRVLSGLSNVLPPMAAWANERSEMMDNLSLKWDNYKTGVQNSYKPDIKFKDAFEDGWSSFGEFAAQEISTQIPIFTTMIASGGISGWAARGMGVTGKVSILGRATPVLPLVEATGAGTFIGATSGGQQYNTMTAQEMMNPFLEYSEAEKFLVSAGYGAAEGVFGTAPSYLLLRNTAGLFTRAGANRIAIDGMKRFFGQNIAFPVIAEPLSEGLTQVTQNMILGRPVMENVDHAMFSGLMFSVVMNAAPAIAGRMMQDFSSVKEMQGFIKLQQEMNAIDKALNRKNSKFKKGTLEYNSLIDSYNNLKDQAEAMVADKYYNITKTGTKAFKDFYDNTTRQANIRSRAQKIVDEGGVFLSAENVSALNALQKDFDQLQRSREIFLSLENFGSEFGNLLGQDQQLYDSYIKKAKQNLKLEGITEPSTVKAFKEASALYAADRFDLYTKNVKKNDLVNMKVFETNQELIDFIDKDPKRKAEFDKKMKKWYIENGNFVYKADTFRNALLRGTINGMNTKINGKTFELISKENSLLNERAGTGYHEFSHSVLFEALAANPEQYATIAKEILDYLKGADKKLYNTMFKSGGTQQANIYNPEEVVVNFLERVAEGKIKDPKFIGVMSEGLAKASGIDIDFKSDLDTIKFLYDIGQKIKDGTFKKSDLKSIKLNLRGKLSEADANVKKEDYTKFSDKNDAGIIQKLYNNLGAEGVKQIANNKYIRTVINEVLRKYENVPGYSIYKKEFEDGLINDPVYGILGSLLKYDAKKHPVLAARIIFNLRQRSKTLAEEIFPQFFSGDTDNRTYEETEPEILDQRESLRISLGLTADVVDRVKQAVLKTFGGKLPNVTSMEFRKKLQESFRIFLKKTIAKDVLGNQDAYKAFLENNFELIYGVLSQGNINKRFKAFAEPVLDKEGKQLREKTAEGNKVFIKRKITEKEFVDYFLGEDVGRSTQGTRKTALAESLAEEIAFDATLTVLRDTTPIDKSGNTLLDRVEQIIEINGEQFSENYLAQVAKEIDRATGFKFSDSSAGITVLDFDDTVAVSKSKVSVTMPNQSAVYNASPKTFEELGKRTGLIFLATDIREAQEYARMNRGEVKQFSINNSSLATEAQVLDIMKQLKIDTSKGLLYEMIDPRFKNFYIGKKNVNKIKAALKEKGFGGFKYTDGTQVVGGTTQSIAVIDKSVIKQPTKLTPSEFAKQHDALKKDGAKFDFSEFNKVIGGEKGPLFGRLQKAVNKFGNKNVFILTARPQAAAPAIKAWLKSQGIALSEKNIAGLEDGSPEAKADWILNKAKEGFNNFYFADDVLENTYAVEQVLSQVDVKYRVDQNFGPTKFSDDGKVEGLVEFLENAIDNEFTGDQLWENMQKNNPLMYSEIVKANKRGETEELFRAKQLKGLLGDKIEIINMEELENVLTSSRKAQDLQVLFKFNGGVTIGFEVKMGPLAKMGSKNSYKTLLKSYGADIMSQIIDIQTDLNGSIFSIFNNEGLIEGEDYYFAPPPGKSETTDGYIEIRYNRKKLLEKTGYDRLARKPNAKRPKGGLLNANGLQLSDTKKYEFNIPTLKPIVDLYTNKGAQYIIIDGKIYSLATNPLNIDTASLLSLPYDSKLQVTMKDETGTSGEGRMIIRGYLQIAEKGTTKNINISEFNDIKGVKTIEEAFTKFSDSNVYLDNEINNIIEQSTTATGKTIKNIVRYSDTKARILGKKGFFRNELKGGALFRFTADDLKGFTYEIMKGISGEAGNKAKKFFVENLHRPYNAGIQALNFESLKLMDDVKALNDKITSVKPKLNKLIEGDVYTNEQAIRIYIWKKQGMDIPGIPKQDVLDLVNHVKGDLSMLEYAEGLIKIAGNKGYPAPDGSWEAGTIKLDLTDDLNTRRRKEHLKEWENNVGVIFSKGDKGNLNKMKVAYGSEFVQQVEDMLERMRTGKNRPAQNKIIREWEEWVNGAVGTIMFYNMRSALLQTISMANYINWHDNNMLAAGKAFANQPQYWKDWIYIFNSDYLKVRRGGLQLNVNENELAETANKKGIKGIFALLLKNGFTPTRIADSLAIATGGAAMYRNRVNSNINKKGMSQEEAEARAFEDFMEVTEDSQQSSRPDKISAQQASGVGRILLAFANTPMQYNRLIKRAGQDLYYGRGDWRSNVSKIVYYSTIQNFIFNALQKGMYALGFGLYEDDPIKKADKTTSVFESMMDTLLSGFGIQGKVAITAKAFGKDFFHKGEILYTMPNGKKGELDAAEFTAQYKSLLKQGAKFDFSKSASKGFYDSDWKNLLELSPPLGSKIKKIMSADYLKKTYKDSKQWEEESIRNPQLMWYANYASTLFNLPFDRMLRKAHNLQSVFSDETENWQKVALSLGWNEWDLGVEGMDLHSEFGKKAIKTDEYLKVREYKKEYQESELEEIESRGYKRVPMTGKNKFIPEGKPGVDYIRIKHWESGNWRYLVTQEVWDKKFPAEVKKKKTKKQLIDEARKRLKKLKK